MKIYGCEAMCSKQVLVMTTRYLNCCSVDSFRTDFGKIKIRVDRT